VACAAPQLTSGMINRCSDAMMDMIKQPNHNNGQDGSLPRTHLFPCLVHSCLLCCSRALFSPVFRSLFLPLLSDFRAAV